MAQRQHPQRPQPAAAVPTSGICPKPSLLRTLAELERVYEAAAAAFDLDRHPRPRITIQTRGRRKTTLGWHWRNAWQPTESDGFSGVDEITIAAEALNRPVNDICSTLLHEMVHHAARWSGIIDVSGKGGYHNGKFKRRAEQAGMIVGPKQGHLGWNDVRPGPALARLIAKLHLDETAFGLARIERQSTVRVRISKWRCGCHYPQTVWSQRREPLMAICVLCLRQQVDADTFDAVMSVLEPVQFQRQPDRTEDDLDDWATNE